MKKTWTIAFDADDTLWHNERGFQMTQARFAEMLTEFTDPADLMGRLLAAENGTWRFMGLG